MHSRLFQFSFVGFLLATTIVLATFFSVTRAEGGPRRVRTPRAEAASITYTPIQPPSYHLAVRNPYLSAWMPSELVANLPSSSLQFWAGQNLGWRVIARVDGVMYNLMGVANPETGSISATVESAEYTSTHSIFTLNTAGTATITLDFFSPVSPSNYLRQSLPFSYLTVSASSSTPRSIQVYSDIDNSWTGQAAGAQWSLATSGTTSVFSMSITNGYTFSQSDEMATWGTTIFASRPSSSSTLTVQSGDRNTLRTQFQSNGSLTGVVSAWATSAMIAIAHDLGTVSTEQSVTFAIGHIRQSAINYLGTTYTHYYRATYPNNIDAVTHFLDDYSAALTESQTLDSDLTTKATAVAGSNYSDIVRLSMAQAYGGIDLVVENDTLDTSSVMAFIKEISSDGNVNTLDVIFPAFPIYYAMEPEYIRLLIEPVLKYLGTGRWTQAYAIHDIGSNYPNATGHDDQVAESMPIEESGNLLTLAYAYTLATGNTTWATTYMTSLEAAVGLKAFGALSGLTNYTALGAAHATLLYTDGLAMDTAKTHLLLQYPSSSTTWKIPFNLFPDILLGLNTFPSTLYTLQNAYYPTIRSAGGVALDNRQWWGKTDWNIWTAATCTTTTVRDMFVDDIWSLISNGLNSWPFSDRWIVAASGGTVGTEYALRARPTVGGHFALLALKGARYLKW